MLIFLCQRSVDSMCVGSYLGSLSISYPYIPLQIPYCGTETQIQFYNEIPTHGCYTHLLRNPLVIGYTCWDELIGFISAVITPIQGLTFQTRKQGVGGHLLTHQFTFLREALTFTLGDFPSSFLVPVPQWRLRQLQVPVGTLAFNEVSCFRQPVFMRPLCTLYPEGRLKSLGNLACVCHYHYLLEVVTESRAKRSQKSKIRMTLIGTWVYLLRAVTSWEFVCKDENPWGQQHGSAVKVCAIKSENRSLISCPAMVDGLNGLLPVV